MACVPIPQEHRRWCHICQNKLSQAITISTEDYFAHIKTIAHIEALNLPAKYAVYNDIDEILGELEASFSARKMKKEKKVEQKLPSK